MMIDEGKKQNGHATMSLNCLPGCHHTHHLNQMSSSWSHQTIGHGSSNPCPTCLGFLVHHLKKRLLSGKTMQTNLMQCATYGLDTDGLTSYSCKLSRNAHTSVFKRPPLVLTLGMCAQSLWVDHGMTMTMTMTVLEGTCHVKQLYGLGHSAAHSVASGLEGTANLHCFLSCTLTTLLRVNVSYLCHVLSYEHIKYNIYKNTRGVLTLVRYCVLHGQPIWFVEIGTYFLLFFRTLGLQQPPLPTLQLLVTSEWSFQISHL